MAVQKKTRDAIVQLFTHAAIQDFAVPHMPKTQEEFCGSDFLLEELLMGGEGYIATNFHLVEKAGGVEVQLPFFVG